MRIESISPNRDRAGCVYVKFDNGEQLRTYPQVVQDFGLYPGKELDGAEWERLRDGAGAMSAKMRAVRIVSASAVSKKDLEQRLRQKGETEAHAAQAVEWMAELSLLDDRETARQIVMRGVSRGYGKARIRQMLYEKRIPKELWDEALEDMEEPDEAICAYLARHLPAYPDKKEKQKVINALLRRGHSWQDVRRCMDRLGQELDEFSEETYG